jgi:hypothetical protein
MTNSKIDQNIDNKVLEEKGNNLLEQARISALNENYNESLKLYDEAFDLFNQIDHNFETKQILWQINEIREHIKWKSTGKGIKNKLAIKDIVSLAAAERRRERLKNGLEGGTKLHPSKPEKISPLKTDLKSASETPKLFQQMQYQIKKEEQEKDLQNNLIKQQQDLRKIQIQEKREKIRELEEKRKQEEVLQAELDDLLDSAKKALNDKKYDDAKSFYENAIKILSQLGWFNQVRTLQKELKNIEIYKKEEEANTIQKTMAQQKYQKELEDQIKKANIEQEHFLEKSMEHSVSLPSEIQQKLKKANLIKIKAEKEEELQKYDRVASRYQYILNIYKTISKDVVDLSDEISKIETKLTELKGKE